MVLLQIGHFVFFFDHLCRQGLWNTCMQAMRAMFWPSLTFIRQIAHRSSPLAISDAIRSVPLTFR